MVFVNSHWALGTCTELVLSVAVRGSVSEGEGRSRKACGIATLKAQPLQELYWALGISKMTNDKLN
ncbi:hypothetical protein LC613_22360 [Nostoc sphaeroides CHAB 2801]|uniref:hypothetical protein n=1 Tax=Nostoc sphaeroides TaxID=446679 RepID=UPI000E4E3522|nr:hypothetical protein [Nostoc sphaeroides]MCC5630594.1 hypothetical protein [Nostoc sphaeroides CHAB 2801]